MATQNILPVDAAHGRADQTMLYLYDVPQPWGMFHAQTPRGPAFYNPNFPVQWFQDGGRMLWIVEGGHYRGGGGYCFITRQIELLGGNY